MLVLAVLAIAFSFVSTVRAATEEELLAYASKEFDIAGQKVKLEEKYVKEVKRYLDAYDVDATAADTIIKKIDKIVDVMNKANVTKYSKLTVAQKDLVKGYAQEAATATGATVTFSNKTAKVVGPDGKDFGAFSSKEDFAQTGNNYMVYALAGVAIIAVASVVGYRKSKVNA